MKKRLSPLLPALTSYARHFFFIAFIVLGILSFFTVKPVLSAIIIGSITAYTFYPAYKTLLRVIGHKKLSALLLSTLLVLAVIIPLFFTANSLVTQTSGVYNMVRTQLRSNDPLGLHCTPEIKGYICGFANQLSEFLKLPDVKVYVTEFVNAISEYVSKYGTSTLLSLPILLTDALVALFTVFYLFLEGEELLGRLKKMIPLGSHHKNEIYSQISDAMYGVVYGSLALLILQGATGILIFWIVGANNPIFWGVFMALMAVLPIIGTWVVWLPMGLSFVGAGNISGESSLVWKGIAVLAYGIFISVPLDIFARPFIMGSRTRIHPMMFLLGVIGGLVTFGGVGLFIGPVILALFSVFIKIYEEERMMHKEV